MTDPDLDAAVGRPSRPFSILLNLAGVVVVGFFLVRQGLLAQPAWVVVLSVVALLAWMLRSATLGSTPSRSRAQSRWELSGTIAAIVTVVVGSLVAMPTQVLGYVPALVCLGALTSSPIRPLWIGMGLALVSLLIVAASVLVLGPVPPNQVLGAGAGLLIAVLVGISRRQFRTAALRERELIEERLRLGDEREHAAALAERSRIARDIHDVLAHSLGGLVLQLDAVDALLESGRTDEARSRVVAARGLAAAGLDEARRAVDTLRDPATSADLGGAIEDLVITHSSLGAAASLRVTGDPVPLPAEAAGALRRAAQEVLSNARRHAPAQPTSLELAWGPDAATLTATTPLAAGAPPSSPGGGRGLVGLRERMEALGGTADWAVRGGAFVVTSTVPLVPEAQP